MRPGPLPSRLLGSHEARLAAFFLLLAGAIGAANPAFLSVANLFDILKSSAVTGVFALGVLVVLVSGGIDVSFAAIGAFSMYAGSKALLALAPSAPAVAAFAVAGALGTALGLLNAALISTYRLPTLIATLGTASVFRGALLAFVGTAIINRLPDGLVAFSKALVFERTLPGGERVGLSASVAVFAALAALTWWILSRTVLGRSIYALGGSAEAAERAGFRPRRIRLFVYAYAGFLAGTAGTLHAATMRNANPFDLSGGELGVIAAVVLGGASVWGGKGSVPGTALGVLTFVAIEASLIFLGIPTEWERVAIGALVVASTASGTKTSPAGRGGGP